jgi:hypothetical protein
MKINAELEEEIFFLVLNFVKLNLYFANFKFRLLLSEY